MGPQQDDTFVNVIQSCADFDRGQIFETRDQLGIGYRTRVNMQGQNRPSSPTTPRASWPDRSSPPLTTSTPATTSP